MNASPDLRYQIESFPALHPREASYRDSPIQSIVLPSAEVDAALGVLLLRESQPLQIYATPAVRQLLVEDNNLFAVLRRQPDQVLWRDIFPDQPFALTSREGVSSGIRCTPVSSGGAFPGHVPPERAEQLNSDEAVLGFFFEHQSRKLAFFPGALHIAADQLEQISGCDAVLFDGTFWSDDELLRLQGQGKTARQMGHLPIGGPGGTLEQFSGVTRPRKIFIHINNSNPMLDEQSTEHQKALDASWEIAFDGMEIEL